MSLPEPADRDNIVASLQRVLADTYGLYLLTHNYHWNVEGDRFVALHGLFEQQYKELFCAVDTIAERIRALGSYALPAEGEKITEIFRLTSNSLNKETEANLRADRMMHNLIALNTEVINSCRIAKETAQDAEDDETADLLIRRITAHQRFIWMLESLLK